MYTCTYLCRTSPLYGFVIGLNCAEPEYPDVVPFARRGCDSPNTAEKARVRITAFGSGCVGAAWRLPLGPCASPLCWCQAHRWWQPWRRPPALLLQVLLPPLLLLLLLLPQAPSPRAPALAGLAAHRAASAPHGSRAGRFARVRVRAMRVMRVMKVMRVMTLPGESPPQKAQG
jgi:hypothetical protein